MAEVLLRLVSTSPGPSTSTLSTGGKKRKDIPRENVQHGNTQNYNPDYLKYGFISSSFNNQETPMCVTCLNQLSKDCMRTGKMIQHLNTMYPEYQNKLLEVFERKAAEQQQQT
jgi:hypothetical protein